MKTCVSDDDGSETWENLKGDKEESQDKEIRWRTKREKER